MIFDMLLIFVVVTIILLLLSIFLVEDYPVITILLILLGMIFSVICTYGLWDVEFFYTGYSSVLGNTTAYIYSTTEYGDPYSYIFIFIFFIFFVLFFRAGFNVLMAEVKKEEETKMKY